MPSLFQQFHLISTHTTASDDEKRLYARLSFENILHFLKQDFNTAVHALRNVYAKGWPVFHGVTDYLLQVRDPEFKLILVDILKFTLADADIGKHIGISYLQSYRDFGLQNEAAITIGPASVSHLLACQDSDTLLRALESGPLEFNLNACVFNDFALYFFQHEDIFQATRDLALRRANYRLLGACQLLLFLNSEDNQLNRRKVTSNGLLCYESDFYNRYLQISKFWEGKYDYEPVVAPSIIVDSEINYYRFTKTYEAISAEIIHDVVFYFVKFLGALQNQLFSLQPINCDDVYYCITEYAVLLQNYYFDVQILELIAYIVVFLIEETYYQNDQEIRFRDQEKQYEVVYLLYSYYQYYNYAKDPVYIPDYYDVMNMRGSTSDKPSYTQNLAYNVELLNGTASNPQNEVKSTKSLGFTAVESRSSHPNQLFKIPADLEYLKLLSAFAKLIIINYYGKQLLDQINLSVSMLRFLIISLFQNETYNVSPRVASQNTEVLYDQEIAGPKFVSYPTACCARIYDRLNSVLYVTQTYPLVLQNFKTMQTPHPRVPQYNINKIAQSSPYYKLQGLYEAPALSIYQFCFPLQKKLQFQNIFGIFKSSPSLNTFIFQPSLTIFLYNVVNCVADGPTNEHSRMIVDTVIHGLQAHPFLCKHESILLCLSSFLLVYSQMVEKGIQSLQVLRFINIFLSTVPIVELCLLLENLNTDLHTYLSAAASKLCRLGSVDDEVRDLQFGNCYSVTDVYLKSVEILYSCFLSAMEAYAQEIVKYPTDFDIAILINTLFMFRHQRDKAPIENILRLAYQLFTYLYPSYSGENKDELINYRKYQLIGYLQAVYVFFNQYKIADPRVFDFDPFSIFTAELRDFYYYQRIFKAQDLHLLRCFQSQIKHHYTQFYQYYETITDGRFVDDIYDRLACALRANGCTIPSVSSEYLICSFLETYGYFPK